MDCVRALGVLLPCCLRVFFLCITFTTAAQTEHCWRQFSNLSTDRRFFRRCFLRVYAIVIRCFTCSKHPTNKTNIFLRFSRLCAPARHRSMCFLLFSSRGSRICSFLAFRSRRAPIISHIIVLRLADRARLHFSCTLCCLLHCKRKIIANDTSILYKCAACFLLFCGHFCRACSASRRWNN